MREAKQATFLRSCALIAASERASGLATTIRRRALRGACAMTMNASLAMPRSLLNKTTTKPRSRPGTMPRCGFRNQGLQRVHHLQRVQGLQSFYLHRVQGLQSFYLRRRPMLQQAAKRNSLPGRNANVLADVERGREDSYFAMFVIVGWVQGVAGAGTGLATNARNQNRSRTTQL